jgi:transcriptional regulator with XRE-family HTH domain
MEYRRRGGRRQSPGLRSAEVAELIGVSDVWYSRCENERSQFSISALERLARVLRLSREERSELLRLARRDVVGFSSSSTCDALSGTGLVVEVYRTFARAAAGASDVSELAAGAAQALRALFGPSSLGYFIENEPAGETQRFIGVAGPTKCDPLFGHVQPSTATGHVRDQLQAATFFEEADVAASASHDFRRLNDALGTRSYHAIAIRQGDEWNYALGCALPEPCAATDLERAMIETVASIVELCVGRIALHENTHIL